MLLGPHEEVWNKRIGEDKYKSNSNVIQAAINRFREGGKDNRERYSKLFLAAAQMIEAGDEVRGIGNLPKNAEAGFKAKFAAMRTRWRKNVLRRVKQKKNAPPP